MRRLTLVARSADSDHATMSAAWLGSLPLSGVERLERLDPSVLPRTDVLWLRDESPARPELIPWLEAGGRLLATHTGVRIAAALGLTPAAPSPILLLSEAAAGLGLAGFGAHPLFTGLRDGATVGIPATGLELWGYSEGRRPGAGGAVAMARSGLTPDPATLLAWELAVGSGGLLCLAFEPAWAERPRPTDAEVLLANAIVGEGIPHRDRAVGVALWPPAGRRAVAAATAVRDALRVPSDPWPPSGQPRLDLTPATEWSLAGRRALVTVGAVLATRDVWVFPFRAMHAATVRGAIACAPGHLAADEVASGLALGTVRLLERWLVAADVPLVVWELTGPPGVEPITAAWSVDLRRAAPYGPGVYGDLRFGLSGDSTALGVESAGGPMVAFGVHGGRLEATGSDDEPVVRVVCRGATPMRIVVAAGVEPGELARAVQVLEREGVAGLASVRARHADQLRLGTALESPDELLGRGFAWARQRGDESLVGVPGVGRSLLTACPGEAGEPGWCFGTGAGPAAAALLVAGHRDPARELLRFLAQTAHPSGGLAAVQTLGGLATQPDVGSTVAFLALAARVLEWTGDEASMPSVAPALAGGLAYLSQAKAPPPAWVLERLDAVPNRELAEAIAAVRHQTAGHLPTDPVETPAVEPHAIVQAAAAALRRAPGALESGGAATALLEATARLWGLEPDAVEGTLGVRPALPPDWDRFALRRVRVGRTLLDLELGRRGQAVVVRASHRFGPSLVLTVGLRGAEVDAIELDEEPLAGGRARFELRGRHEIRFQLR